MHLIVCIDERDGMSFCGRRLSRDRAVTDRILDLTAGSCLWMHPVSAGLFQNKKVLTDPSFLGKAAAGDYYFAEVAPLPERIEALESVILFHWNRAYPSTVKFPRKLLTGMHLVHTEDFPGNSHDKITMERYSI